MNISDDELRELKAMKDFAEAAKAFLKMESKYVHLEDTISGQVIKAKLTAFNAMHVWDILRDENKLKESP